MPARRNSLTSRPWRVRFRRSPRPRAWGGVAGDVLDAQPGEDLADDGGLSRIDLPAGRPELGVEQPLGRIVQDGEHDRPLRGAEGEPPMGTAIEVQQRAEAGAGLPAAAVAAASAALAHEAGFLPGDTDE